MSGLHLGFMYSKFLGFVSQRLVESCLALEKSSASIRSKGEGLLAWQSKWIEEQVEAAHRYLLDVFLHRIQTITI